MAACLSIPEENQKDTKEFLWKIVGAIMHFDESFPPYLVYDKETNTQKCDLEKVIAELFRLSGMNKQQFALNYTFCELMHCEMYEKVKVVATKDNQTYTTLDNYCRPHIAWKGCPFTYLDFLIWKRILREIKP